MIRLPVRPLLPLLIALPLAAQEHDLRLSVQKGASVWLQQSTTQAQEIDMGQVMETENVMDLTLHVTVKEVSDEGIVIVEANLARIRGSFDMPQMGKFPFDSIDNDGKAPEVAEEEDDGFDDFGAMMPDLDRIGKAATAMAGTKFVAKLDSYGRVTSIDGVAQSVEAMQKRAGKMGGQMLSGTFSESSIKNLIASAFGERPTKPTAEGGTWDREKADGDKLNADAKVIAKLARVTDDSFEVTGKGTIEQPTPKAPAEGEEETEEEAMVREMQKGMKIENGAVTFRSVTSRKDGFLVEAQTEMSVDISMPGPFGDIAMKNKTTIVTKRTTEQAAMKKDGDK